MNVSQAEFQNMKEEIVKDLIARLMDERGLSMQEAFDTVYNSRLFEKLQNSACLIVFLDKAFLADEHLTDILIKEYQAGKDLAVCMIGSIEDSDLPRELIGLHKMQWLNFAYGITDDMNTKLFRHLQKRGCRNTTILPGFDRLQKDGERDHHQKIYRVGSQSEDRKRIRRYSCYCNF